MYKTFFAIIQLLAPHPQRLRKLRLAWRAGTVELHRNNMIIIHQTFIEIQNIFVVKYDL